MYLVKTPWLLRQLYSSLIWHLPNEENKIYLTFDDGPHPTITPFVLDVLKKYNAKATFFCIGKNVTSHPEIYLRIIEEGHRVGNHTYSHLNGWKAKDREYFADILEAEQVIETDLFRPPYGRISRVQAKEILPKFKIIMWDILSGDFDIKLSPQKCLEYVTKKTKPGSIIVFHDSEKAFPRLEYALPKALEFFAEKGFICSVIE